MLYTCMAYSSCKILFDSVLGVILSFSVCSFSHISILERVKSWPSFRQVCCLLVWSGFASLWTHQDPQNCSSRFNFLALGCLQWFTTGSNFMFSWQIVCFSHHMVFPLIFRITDQILTQFDNWNVSVKDSQFLAVLFGLCFCWVYWRKEKCQGKPRFSLLSFTSPFGNCFSNSIKSNNLKRFRINFMQKFLTSNGPLHLHHVIVLGSSLLWFKK